ncbi:MAG: putative Ig domain-containing protein, partial [Acidimicrobiia bacterium]|nr:putative Ig domain-containing protein [Acidimicrobiia bacterium]
LFTWSVANTTRAPVVAEPGDQTSGEDDSVSLAIYGIDPDGDRLSWSAMGLPPGLSINPITGIVGGTAHTPGVFTVTVTATNDGVPLLSASAGLTWTVIAAEPVAPVIDPLEDRSDLIGLSVTIRPVAMSPDGQELAWSAAGLPAGITSDPESGKMTGTLEESGVFEVEVKVTDPRGLSATAGFVWTIGEGMSVNEPPRAEDDQIDVIESELIDGQVLLDVLVNDTDPEGSALRITWLGDVPVGEAWISGATMISFHPPADWLGTTQFSYVVADAAGNTDTAHVSVTIAPDLEERAAGSTLIWVSSEAARPTSVIGVIRTSEAQLVMSSIVQSLHVLRMPLVLLGGAVIWSLLLGGAFNITLLLRGGVPFLSRKARVPLAIVMAHHGQRVPAHTDPGQGEVIHRFPATAKGIAGTGRYATVEGVEWAEVDTPEGRGWVETVHVTEHIDSETFAEDPAPLLMVEGFVEALRRKDDLSSFVSRHGLWLSHHDDPVCFGPDQMEQLTRSTQSHVWKGRNPAYPNVRGSFSDVVSRGLIEAWDQPDRAVAVDRPWVPSTVIPVEYTNLHTLSIGAVRSGRARLDQTAWLAHFSYERNTPYLIAVTREG